MAVELTRAVQSRRRERARLRTAVLRPGGLVGWHSRAVKAFVGALIGSPCCRARTAELGAVLEEYVALARAIEARTVRRSPRQRAGCHAARD